MNKYTIVYSGYRANLEGDPLPFTPVPGNSLGRAKVIYASSRKDMLRILADSFERYSSTDSTGLPTIITIVLEGNVEPKTRVVVDDPSAGIQERY